MLGISLWIGSLAWTGFIMLRTVLDPGRSEAVADALLEDPAVHDQLVDNIAGGVQAALPAGAPVARADVEAAAETALDSPEVEALFRSALVDTHQAFLGEGEPPDSIDGSVFGAAARDALVAERPELDGVLPASPSLEVPLPTERVPDLGPVRRALETAVPLLAGVATIGALLALLVTSNRPAMLRRAGIWAIGLSSIILLVGFGVPAMARNLFPDQAAVVAALVAALAGASRGPALTLAGAGLAGVLASLVWRPAAAAVAKEPPPRRRDATPRRPPPPASQRRRRTVHGGTPTRAPRPPSGPPRRPPVRPPTAPPMRLSPSGPEPTMVQPSTDRRPTPPQGTPPGREGRRWVEGVGWVVDASGHIPEGARWVAGVGYVVDP